MVVLSAWLFSYLFASLCRSAVTFILPYFYFVTYLYTDSLCCAFTSTLPLGITPDFLPVFTLCQLIVSDQ